MLFYHQHQYNQCYLLSYPGIHIAIEFINLIYLFISLALLPEVTYQPAKSDTSVLYSPCKHAASENSIKELPKSRIKCWNNHLYRSYFSYELSDNHTLLKKEIFHIEIKNVLTKKEAQTWSSNCLSSTPIFQTSIMFLKQNYFQSSCFSSAYWRR